MMTFWTIFTKHAVHEQKDHGNRNGAGGGKKGKRTDAEYKAARAKFRSKQTQRRTNEINQRDQTVHENTDLLAQYLRHAHRQYRVKPSDGVGTQKRKQNMRSLSQRYASYKLGSRKTDPTPSFESLLDKTDIKSVKIRVDAAFAKAAEGRSLPSHRELIPNPETMRRTVGAEGYTDRVVRRVKPTGRVQRRKR